jgi:nitrile hydratase subunit beta
MTDNPNAAERFLPEVFAAEGEEPGFFKGDRIKIAVRFPVGHYRVPMYLRGKLGVIDMVIEPTAINNEEEGFGRNAGSKRHYYRISVQMLEIWHDYSGAPVDELRIEVFETWLERV